MSENNTSSTAPVEAPIEESTSEGVEGSEIESSEAAPSVKQEAAKAEKKFLKSLKLKIDGKEVDEELPFELPDDPKAIEYMKRHLQMGRMGQSRAQEKAELEKRVTGFIDALRANPRAILADPTLGIDIKKLAAEVIQEEIENSKKSPEQLDREKLEAELKQVRDEREKEKEEYKKAEFARLQQIEHQRYDTAITEALKTSDLPKSPYVVKKIADYMLLGLQKGMDVSPEDVLPLVREEITSDIRQMFEVMPEDVVEKLIGKDKINSLRKKNLAKAKEKPPSPLSSLKSPAGKTEKKAPEKKQSFKQFFGV